MPPLDRVLPEKTHKKTPGHEGTGAWASTTEGALAYMSRRRLVGRDIVTTIARLGRHVNAVPLPPPAIGIDNGQRAGGSAPGMEAG